MCQVQTSDKIRCKIKTFIPLYLQMIIEQLEHERNTMADAIEEKMKEHQHLVRVKMDLGMEVAAYR